MAFDLLSDLLVLEAAHYGPDALGGRLADMGARVIKVEDPQGGDPVRRGGAYAVGGADGYSYLHLRWNRGKESVIIDLGTEKGRSEFLALAKHADVVIEGMRAGVLKRLGLGFDVLKAANPALVFCSLSGLGASGPYAALASHGPSFDSFAGLAMPQGESISRYQGTDPALVGMYAYGLEAAFAVVSAVLRARRTGEGIALELAAAESAAHWLPEALDPLLNPTLNHERPGFLDASGRMLYWARLENYRCADGKIVLLMAYTPKSWLAFLDAIGRPELAAIYERDPLNGDEDAQVHAILERVFATRSRREWMSIFTPANIAVMPVNSFADLIEDPHFTSRPNTYDASLPDGRPIKLTSTAIRVKDQAFSAALAPDYGADDEAIRAEFGL